VSWDNDAQSSKKGTGSKTAGDPVVPCVEQSVLEPLIDFNEPSDVAPMMTAPAQSAVKPLVSVEPGSGPLKPKLEVPPPPPAISSKLETGPAPKPEPRGWDDPPEEES
jgi:hypothetical protein